MASSSSDRGGTTFLFVHGGRHGGWCWKKVAAVPRRSGCSVLTPTLTPGGERRHLLAPSIDLSTHVTDIANVMEFDDLSEVVLVAHNYGGMVATAVADRFPDRVTRLVYLDALVRRDGVAVLDLITPEYATLMRAMVASHGDGWRLPAGPALLEQYGVHDPGDLAWAALRVTDQPFATYQEPLRLSLDSPLITVGRVGRDTRMPF